ncbi:hypothetical protein OF83DRAFT_1051178 [Amylostereum chailletii]|nr:hypothetical protein OF83DRAFT_1051178 [Amylostereum chailletii]
MSGLSSFLPFKTLGSTTTRDRPPDALSRLQSVLQTMPASRKYVFTPSTRAEILSELYNSFWGSYAHPFLPNSNSSLPLHTTLSEVQTRLNFSGAAEEDPPVPGRPCGRIFRKGESCFRCKDCSLDDSCVLCSRCFHATDHTDHNVSFFIAQQSGGCCDCGDSEAWRGVIQCPFHPSVEGSPWLTPASDRNVIWGRDIPPVPNYPQRVTVPPELRESMSKTVALAFDFILETLDCSPEETTVPAKEADLHLQPTCDPMFDDQYCVVLWNDEKHSFNEVIDLLMKVGGYSREDASNVADKVDELGREIIEMSSNISHLLEMASIISQIEIGVTVRRAYDTFREHAVTAIIDWLVDLTRSRLSTDAIILREVIAEELLMPRKRSSTTAGIPEVARVIKVYGEAFAHSTPAELVAAITTVVHHILMTCTLADDRLDRSKHSGITFHEVMFGDSVYSVVAFDVLEGWVSFHHSLQWLLAELFKHVDILSESSLREVGLRSIRDILLRNASEKAVLTIIDFPLRVLAMVAQIRTGLWVRNGFAIRGQLLHYRDFMLRELCYDQDLYMMQASFIILDPDIVLVSMLDRFQLRGFFSGAIMHPSYEGSQLLSMVEEILYILIAIFSENGHAGKMPTATAVRREIVHALAIGSCTFTDLVKRVAERLVDDPCFERVLQEVANFRPPEAISDSGQYELKAEVYEEVNPFFYHYSRNKREEVETVLRNHYKKRGDPDHVIVPKPLGITQGPFVALATAFESEVLLQIMFYAILNILILTESTGAAPPSGEAILDQALHLIMLALVERPLIFSQLAAIKTFDESKNLIDVLCALEHHETYRGYKARTSWVLDELTKHVSTAVISRRRVLDDNAEDPENAKKKAARARQEAIMKQMKAQQASFAINFEDDEDDVEEEPSTTDVPVSFGTCIVCQEELNASKPFGALGLMQSSKLIRRHPDNNSSFMNEVIQTSYSLDRSTTASPAWTFPPRPQDFEDSRAPPQTFEIFQPQNTRFGLHGSICSHLMHLECFNVYTVSIRQRHRSQSTRNHPESIPRKEFICPLCKSLGNVILPVSNPTAVELNTLPFADWTRAAGISILKSKPDPILDSLLVRNGTGELAFWAAQDPGYVSFFRQDNRWTDWDMHKMVDSVMNVARAVSQQSRHLRDRPEPEQGERGAGMYLPEDLVGYTVACLEIAQRGVPSQGGIVADNITESQTRMLRGFMAILTKLAAISFKGRPDDGKEALRQAIIKRLLPEWSLSTMNPVTYPLLLRDPFTILVETAAVAPEMLRHVLTLAYYACLARTVIGLIYVLNKTRSWPVQTAGTRAYTNLFGDLRMFFTSVVRHSPVVEHASEIVFSTYGEARIEKLVYTFTLPFLRRAAILCRAVFPSAFPSPAPDAASNVCEYTRLLNLLGIPPLADLPSQETLQTSLSGWCSHYGHSPVASQLNCGIILENPTIYRIARLPVVLDTLFSEQDRAMTCKKCNTVPLDAAICLVCGTIVCFQSHCCMDREHGDKGECNMHTRECGGVIGLFFLVKRCSLLYLHAGNGCFTQSPYLDAHGEIDMSMRRGRRQFLHPARWEEVRKIWLNHGIPTLVARKLEGTVDAGGWETL